MAEDQVDVAATNSLAKVTLELEGLQQDQKMHAEAIKMSEACNSYVAPECLSCFMAFETQGYSILLF